MRSVQTKLEPQSLVIADALRAELAPYFASPQSAGGYHNPWDHPPLASLSGVLRWKTQPNAVRPKDYRAQALTVAPDALAQFEALAPAATRVFWIGHASFMLEMDGSRVVIDPIFGRAGGLVPRVTPAAARAEELGELSAVLVTHGHHDHLDPNSLKALALANRDRVVFVVPAGLASALPRECQPVVELSWWQHVTVGGLRIHLVPAQHWHRRGLFDLNKSLWGGFVVEGTHRVYHSGDTGHFGGFAAIGKAFGGIDAACLPLGAYEPSWFMAAQHMSPEGSLDAYHQLGATHFIGMHWGTFDLSDEPLEAGPQFLHDTVAARGLPPERFHVLAPGGSLALHEARGSTRAVTRLLWQR